MNQTTFTSILDAPAAEAERPPQLPVGQYVVAIQGMPKRDKSSKKGTEYIEYPLVVQAPVDGSVDEEALAAFVETSGSVMGKNLKDTHYLTENSAYRHKEFCFDILGLEDKGQSHWELAQEAPGLQYIVTIKHEPTQDGKGIQARIGDRAAAE